MPGDDTCAGAVHVQQQRVIMRLYGNLRLSQHQKEQLASLWRSWCRRRAALSHKLMAAVGVLQSTLPNQSTLPSSLMHAVHVACELGCVPQTKPTADDGTA